MMTIQIGCYQDELESIVEVVNVSEMTEEEFIIQEAEIDVFDDGGSHTLHKYSKALVAELREVNATNLHKLDCIKTQ